VWIISWSRPWRNFAWLSRVECEDGPPWACSQPCPAPPAPPLTPPPPPPPPPPPAPPLLLPPLLLHPASPGAGMPLLPHAPDTPPTLVSLLLVAFGCCWNTHIRTQCHFGPLNSEARTISLSLSLSLSRSRSFSFPLSFPFFFPPPLSLPRV